VSFRPNAAQRKLHDRNSPLTSANRYRQRHGDAFYQAFEILDGDGKLAASTPQLVAFSWQCRLFAGLRPVLSQQPAFQAMPLTRITGLFSSPGDSGIGLRVGNNLYVAYMVPRVDRT
jgi:hypothetical protein